MKTVFLALLLAGAAVAQPIISGPNPQIRRGSTLYNIGTVNTFTGSGPPGTISASLRGDLYLDLTGNITYQCYIGSGACNAVASGNWVQVSGSSGSFVNLTVSTLTVTSPLFNSAQFTGGITVGGDIGLTGGLTAGGGLTVTGSASLTNLQINSNSTAAIHIPNGGITIDAGFANTSITAAGNIVVTGSASVQTPFLQVTNLATFNGGMNVTGSGVFSGSLTSAGLTSTGGITATGNIVSSTGDVRAGGNHVRMVADGSFVWANGAANLDISGNVNGVNGTFSGTTTSPNFFSNTGNFKVSGDNIIMNRNAANTVQQIQMLVSNSANTVGTYIIGSDVSGNLGLSTGNGGSNTEVAHFDRFGNLTIGGLTATAVNSSGGVTGTAAVFTGLNVVPLPTTCSGHPTGTIYNTTTSATGGGTAVGVCP